MILVSVGWLGQAAATDQAGASPGERLARQVCAACHLFPPPAVLDRKSWQEQILPRMETRLGVSPPDYSRSDEGPLLESLHLYPETPLLPRVEWDAIVEYYLNSAPVVPLPQDARPEIAVGLDLFALAPVQFRHTPPLTTLVKVSVTNGRIMIGDNQANALAILDSSGKLLDSIRIDNVPISVAETEKGIYITAIGSVQPSEIQRGALYFLERKGEAFGSLRVIQQGLPRATHTELGDFNGDGRTDFAICMFGNHRGRFSWFENLGDGKYQEHVLLEKSGAIHCVAHDFNGDGHSDIGLLIAQESEAFTIFINNGHGQFGSRLVFQRQPAFGHNWFELADFNGDGRTDLLVVNGDNGEYESPLKNYHGLRVYLNRGDLRFEENYFFPLNGATKALARDFDEDGDLDIAAISFFPDYVNAPRESFVYLENRGGFDFVPATFPQCIAGRWIAMDAGDVDGDGDLDLVLGSFIRGPTAVPAALSRIWEQRGPSFLVLKNTLRQRPRGTGSDQ